MSDLVGAGLFRPELLSAALGETNELAEDQIVIAAERTVDSPDFRDPRLSTIVRLARALRVEPALLLAEMP